MCTAIRIKRKWKPGVQVLAPDLYQQLQSYERPARERRCHITAACKGAPVERSARPGRHCTHGSRRLRRSGSLSLIGCTRNKKNRKQWRRRQQVVSGSNQSKRMVAMGSRNQTAGARSGGNQPQAAAGSKSDKRQRSNSQQQPVATSAATRASGSSSNNRRQQCCDCDRGAPRCRSRFFFPFGATLSVSKCRPHATHLHQHMC